MSTQTLNHTSYLSQTKSQPPNKCGAFWHAWPSGMRTNPLAKTNLMLSREFSAINMLVRCKHSIQQAVHLRQHPKTIRHETYSRRGNGFDAGRWTRRNNAFSFR